MRRMVMVMALVGLLVAIFAAAALAVNKQCSNYPCYGTNARDTLYERGGNGVPDKIWGLRYGDRINATTFGADTDILNGGRGNDTLNSQDGDRSDTVNGGYGYDECLVDRPVEAGWGCDVVGYAIE